MGDGGEFEILARLRRHGGAPRTDVRLASGDDAAAIDLGLGRLLLVTCDAQVEGVHFVAGRIDPTLLGRRAAAAALSDIAAMGGQATHALVSIVASESSSPSLLEALQQGLSSEMERWGVAIVGGNLSRGPILSLEVSVIGTVRSTDLLTRRGARVGDRLLVSGRVGTAAAGLCLAADPALEVSPAARSEALAAHQTPTPRLDVARALVRAGGATAAIDISDGLAGDLGHLIAASAVGASIDVTRLPIARSTVEVARALGLDPLELALGGGEDYELLLTAPSARVAALRAAVARDTEVELSEIGEIRPQAEGLRQITAQGERPLLPTGFRHFPILG